MNITIVNQQGHNFGDEAAGAGLLNRILQYEEVENVTVLYASDSILPITDSRIIHKPDISLKNVGFKNLITYYLFGSKIVKNKKLNEWIRIINNSDIIFVSPCGASIGIYKDYRYLLRLLIVVKEKKIPVFHYNTINSSKSIIFDSIAKYILNRSDVNVREKKSKLYLDSIGIESTLGTDSAFLLSPLENMSKSSYISFIPAHFDDWHPYFKKNNIDEKFNS